MWRRLFVHVARLCTRSLDGRPSSALSTAPVGLHTREHRRLRAPQVQIKRRSHASAAHPSPSGPPTTPTPAAHAEEMRLETASHLRREAEHPSPQQRWTRPEPALLGAPRRANCRYRERLTVPHPVIPRHRRDGRRPSVERALPKGWAEAAKERTTVPINRAGRRG